MAVVVADPSIKDLAYRALAATLGGPVDVTTMFMRPFGYSTPPEQVVGGSEWMGQKLQDTGVISKARNPTQEFISSLMIPTPSGAGTAAVKGAGLIPDLLGAMMGFGAAGSFRNSTPTNIDPTVGKRFETEFLGGLIDKKPVNLEDYMGSSVMVMPWDKTSRNVAVKSVSDVDLPVTEITHGGQDYARDIIHQQSGVAGASNKEIAKRIATREQIAQQENLAAGGTGRILHLPITMGDYSENFSVMPTNILLGVIDKATASKDVIKNLNDSIRKYPVPKKIAGKNQTTYPFKDFKGIDTEEGRKQLMDGEGISSTAGNLRKAFVEKMYLKTNQKAFGFNAEDIVSAVSDPSLINVPKGYVGNTIVGSSPNGMVLTPSSNPTYDTNFSAEYLGTLGQSIPIENFMPRAFDKIAQELSGRQGNLRQNTIGALEKRNENVSEIIDDQFLQNLSNYYQSIRQ